MLRMNARTNRPIFMKILNNFPINSAGDPLKSGSDWLSIPKRIENKF